MDASRTVSMTSLWTALAQGEALFTLDARSRDAFVGARERLDRQLAELRIPDWRLENRSRGAVIRLAARSEAWWSWDDALELRGEMLPDGAGSRLRAVALVPRTPRMPTARGLASDLAILSPVVAVALVFSLVAGPLGGVFAGVVIAHGARFLRDSLRRKRRAAVATQLLERLAATFPRAAGEETRLLAGDLTPG